MKIIVTGSLGHISKPLTEELLKKGHTITVISSNAERQNDIEEMGATAAIGSVEDVDFLTKTFTGADAAYCMIPPANYFDHSLNLPEYTLRIAGNYATAIEKSRVQRVVFLSSIGAHLAEGNGIIKEFHEVENMLSDVPGVAITFMRPTSFYYNIYGFMGMIKQGFIAANYGEDKIIYVSPKDISEAVADEIVTPSQSKKILYVASDELTGPETAKVIGEAIGKRDLTWKLVTDDQTKSGLEAAGMQPAIVAGLAEMNSAMRSGKVWEDYQKHKPVLGKVKLEDFAKEFAIAYHKPI
ncbi:MAG TPA: NmrA family NAD(P)-binding protein [Chitinophagaceae bacterium]|nr:NmrA family NAD(P)-binding protein [Chitinophagaceae bacterium]